MTTDTTPRVLTLSETADRLNMKRSNVAKFLARRGVQRAFAKRVGYFWYEDAIDQVKAEREADEERMAADERRRESALRRADGQPAPEPVRTPSVRLGRTQRDLMEELRERPARPSNDARRLALRRLRERGLVENTPGERGLYQLTDSGLEVAGQL